MVTLNDAGGYYSLRDQGGHILFEAQYQGFKVYADRIAAFDGSKWGLFDTLGNQIMPCEYDEISSISNNGKYVLYGIKNQEPELFEAGYGAQGNAAQDGDTPYRAVYDASTRIGDDELVYKNLKLGMSFDDAMSIIGEYDEEFYNSDTMKSYVKDNMRYVFEYYGENYCLYAMMLDDNRYIEDDFVRGVHLGDSLSDVLQKLPGKDKTPKKWAEQFIYGSRESDAYAFLSYDYKYTGWYNFIIKTPSGNVNMLFDRDEKLMNTSMRLDIWNS